MGSSSSSRFGFCKSSLASAIRICQPPENSSVRRCHSSLRKPRPVSTASHLRFDRIPVAGTKFMLDALIAFRDLAIFRRRMIEFWHARGQVFHLLFHFSQPGKTAMHSANTVRPESVSPSCGR